MYWQIQPKRVSRESLEISNRPLVLGAAMAPRLKNELKRYYEVYDGRGPLPISIAGRMERDGMSETTLVRTVVLVEDTLLTPSDKYLKQWFPKAPIYTVIQGGDTKIFDRPWITAHSVRDIIMTLVMKQQKGWRHEEKMKRLSVALLPGTEKKPPENEILVNINTSHGYKTKQIATKTELRLMDVTNALKEMDAQEIELYLHKGLCREDQYMGRRDWFTTAILNVTNGVERVRIKVYDEDSLQEVENAVERVKNIWERNMGEMGKESTA